MSGKGAKDVEQPWYQQQHQYVGQSQPYTGHPQPYTRHSQPYTGQSQPYTEHSQPSKGHSQPYSSHPQHYAGRPYLQNSWSGQEPSTSQNQSVSQVQVHQPQTSQQRKEEMARQSATGAGVTDNSEHMKPPPSYEEAVIQQPSSDLPSHLQPQQPSAPSLPQVPPHQQASGQFAKPSVLSTPAHPEPLQPPVNPTFVNQDTVHPVPVGFTYNPQADTEATQLSEPQASIQLVRQPATTSEPILTKDPSCLNQVYCKVLLVMGALAIIGILCYLLKAVIMLLLW